MESIRGIDIISKTPISEINDVMFYTPLYVSIAIICILTILAIIVRKHGWLFCVLNCLLMITGIMVSAYLTVTSSTIQSYEFKFRTRSEEKLKYIEQVIGPVTYNEVNDTYTVIEDIKITYNGGEIQQ